LREMFTEYCHAVRPRCLFAEARHISWRGAEVA
jgi:hypothetical protein